jgi:hypothetical protein
VCVSGVCVGRSRVLVFIFAGLQKRCILPASMFALAASVIVKSALAAM